MSDNSTIEWTDATWNPITGCSVVSPGCTNCYAMGLAGTRLKNHPSRKGLTQDSKAGPVWNGKVRFNEGWLDQPLRWKRPRMIFVCAHGDLFHENVPDEWIDRVFAVMAIARWHTFQVLTKRPERMRAYFAETWQPAPARTLKMRGLPEIAIAAEERGDDRWDKINEAIDGLDISTRKNRFWTPEGSLIGRPAWPRQPLPNVWLGISAEDQRRADERIPDLLATPAAVRFVSAKPLLGPIDFTWIAEPDDTKDGVIDALLGCNWIDGGGRGVTYRPSRPGHEGREMTRYMCSSDEDILASRKLDWVIVGGESGACARPMHPEWARSIRDQCAAAGVPFFFKQWGEWAPSTPEQADGNPRSGWQTLKAHPHVARAEELYPEAGAAFVEHVGKKHAGRLLDGVEHNGMPGRAG